MAVTLQLTNVDGDTLVIENDFVSGLQNDIADMIGDCQDGDHQAKAQLVLRSFLDSSLIEDGEVQ